MQVQFLKRPAAAVFAAILLIFSVPASAAESDYSGSVNGFWNSYLYSWAQGYSGIPLIGDAVQSVVGAFCSDVCSSSSDALHHASSVSSDIGSDEYGFFAMATCDYCHARFKVYGSDLSTAYDTYVSDLQTNYNTTNINNNGLSSLVIAPWENYSVPAGQTFVNSSSDRPMARYYQNVTASGYIELSCSSHIFSVPTSGTFTFLFPTMVTSVRRSSDPIYFYLYISTDGGDSWTRASTTTYPDDVSSYNLTFNLSSSCVYYLKFVCKLALGSIGSEIYYDAQGPVYLTGVQVFPSSSSLVSIDSRPTSITGDYGIIGDNGQITKVDNNTIVNETNNTIYNPVTDTTTPISSWSYDYSDRSYNVVTESGDTITVTYGDENITIHEGDTVYNVYYLVDSSGSSGEGGTDTPSSCIHDYTSTVTTAATCEAPGLRTYICSKCGNTYTEKIPSTGHTWTVKQSVATEYDEDGNITQQGYTIYKCAVCGTEYKDEAGTGPPNNSVDNTGDGESLWDKLGALIGTVGNGILILIDAVAGKLLDGLISLADMISGKFSQVVELILSWFDEIPALFGGFLDFLGAVFPFIPEEAMLLLTFGIAVIVFIGIIKALRR